MRTFLSKAACLCALAAPFLFAQTATLQFTAINYPGADATYVNSINNLDVIAGTYNKAGQSHGFTLKNSNYSTIDIAGAVSTLVNGIDDNGDVVGAYTTDGSLFQGFLLKSGGQLVVLDYPHAANGTQAYAVNKKLKVVGGWYDAADNEHGFTWKNGVFTRYDYPNATATGFSGISNLGVIAGEDFVPSLWHAFVKAGTTLKQLPDFEGTAIGTVASGVNDKGDVVGSGYPDGFYALQAVQGPVNYVTVSYPGAKQTVAHAINNNRTVVGYYWDSNFVAHGFSTQVK